MRSVRNVLICIALSLVLSVGVARADERSAALDKQATDLYQQVLSPFCPGRSLNDCPSSKAAELKDQMRAELEAGKSGEEVLQGVFQRFGDEYRAVPKFTGVGILVWLAPASFILIGLLLAVKLSSRGGKNIAVTDRSAPTRLSKEDEQRVQEELARLE